MLSLNKIFFAAVIFLVLISVHATSIEADERIKEADDLYTKAYDSYTSGDYENASVLVNAALRNYSSLLQYTGISRAEFLRDSINEKLALIYEAELHYNKSLSFYGNAYFENASYYANNSLEIYQEINQEKDVQKLQELLDDIQEGIEKKKEADELYERAVYFFNVADLNNSEIEANNAKDRYEEIKWRQGIQKSERLLQSIQDMEESSSEIETVRFALPPIILIAILLIPFTLLIIAVILIWWEKKKG